MSFNVDGGYLSFKMAFGNFDSWVMKYGQQVSLFAVDNKPKRKKLYPLYKQSRNTEAKKENIQMVWELRKRIENEALLPICSIEGLEADDLVACWALFNDDDIIGVDKDFFQIPNLSHTFYHNLKAYHKEDVINKLPSFVQPLAKQNFALYQMLLGDVADNIPRLLAKGKLGKWQIEVVLDVVNTPFFQKTLLELFGDSIILNAQLVLLPYYEYCESKDWFGSWCRGAYHYPEYWQGLYNQMQQVTLKNSVVSEVDSLKLFDLY